MNSYLMTYIFVRKHLRYFKKVRAVLSLNRGFRDSELSGIASTCQAQGPEFESQYQKNYKEDVFPLYENWNLFPIETVS